MNLEAIKREAECLAKEHPSKDCRSFASQIPEVVELLHEMAAALEEMREYSPCIVPAILKKYKEAMR